MINTERMTVSLIPRAAHACASTAIRLEMNKTDVINRALQAYDYLSQVVADGGKVIIERAEGVMPEVVTFL
jgi:hypothetical protein